MESLDSYRHRRKAYVLIALGLGWLGIVAWLFLRGPNAFAGVGIDIAFNPRLALVVFSTIGIIFTLGWLFPLIAGIRLLIKGRR